MPQIQPTINKQDIVCAETPAPPCGFVVFGASGDLVRRKLFKSIFQLYTQNLLNDNFYLLGCGRTKLSDEQFRELAKESVRNNSDFISSQDMKAFLEKLYYIDGNYDDGDFYQRMRKRADELNKKYKGIENIVFYLAVPPFLYATIVDQLKHAQLSCSAEAGKNKNIRLVIEKPFGHDLESATQLNERIGHCFDESQIYRIDHYLGKETVQNILMFRFANLIFEPIWNRNYIDHIQITISESIGVGHRANYYDKSGALRDMFQNHMLQMLALAAMEPPVSFEADSIRDEKVKLLKAIRPVDIKTINDNFVRAQYGPGKIKAEQVKGYLDEKSVAKNSKTETFVAARLFIDNWRWKGVPFYLRTGKAMKAKDTEIVVYFKSVPHSLFASVGLDEMPPNVLVFQIQPEEGMSLSFQAKRPGSKICMTTLDMNFNYKNVFLIEMPEAYQRLLLDCMLGDQTLFTRYDSVEASWKLLEPVLQAWQKDEAVSYTYPAGSESFPQADDLIESDGRKWRNISVD